MTYPWNPTEAEKKALKRKAIRNLAMFVGIKVGIAVGIYYLGKKLDGDIDLPYEDDFPDSDEPEWYTNPYTRKISDGTIAGLVGVDFLE